MLQKEYRALTQNDSKKETESEELERRQKAFERLNQLIEPVVVDDEKEELAKYKDKKYGI